MMLGRARGTATEWLLEQLGHLPAQSPRPKTAASPRSPAQALVEFAIVAPLMFFLFLALVEGGRLGVSAAMVVNAAREAAHAGTFDSVDTDAPLRTAGNRAVPMLGTLPPSAFTISPKGTDNGGPGRAPGGTISVTVNYAFPVNPLFATLFGNTISLRSTSTMPVE